MLFDFGNLGAAILKILVVIAVLIVCFLIFLMVFNTKKLIVHENSIWHDVKRSGPFPITWHGYELSDDRIFEKGGLLRVVETELYLYLITDVRLV